MRKGRPGGRSKDGEVGGGREGQGDCPEPQSGLDPIRLPSTPKSEPERGGVSGEAWVETPGGGGYPCPRRFAKGREIVPLGKRMGWAKGWVWEGRRLLSEGEGGREGERRKETAHMTTRKHSAQRPHSQRASPGARRGRNRHFLGGGGEGVLGAWGGPLHGGILTPALGRGFNDLWMEGSRCGAESTNKWGGKHLLWAKGCEVRKRQGDTKK